MVRFSGSSQVFFLAGAFAVGIASTAAAADLPSSLPPPPVYEAPAPAPIGGGWYLRGDVGYGFEQMSGYNSSVASTVAGFQYRATGLDGQTSIGGGFGYQLNNWFRADVTAEYRTPTNFSAIESYAAGPGYNAGADGYSAHLQSTVALVNGYVDVGTWYGFTPFVGAGVGAAFHKFSGLTDVGLGPGNFGAYGVAAPSNSTQLAWALMTGIDYSIAPNWKLEFSYRYLDMGRVASNGILCEPACAPPYESVGFHVASQDVRVGLRYIFAEVPPPAPMLQAPLVSKY
jgi:opacity protein-like surface antigen